MTRADDLRATLADGSPGSLIQASDAASASWRENAGPADIALFEPRMADRQGHFALLADQYLDLAEVNDRVGAVFHHQSWSGERPPGWHRLFPIPDHLVGAGFPADRAVLATYTDYFRQALAHGLGATDASVAIFPTARFLTLPAIAWAISELPSVRGAMLGVMETWPVPDCKDHGLVEEAFRQAANILRGAGKEVLVFAESEAIADGLLTTGFPRSAVQTAPYPAAARFAGYNPDRAGSDSPRFLALGAGRPVHNPGLLAEYLLCAARSDRSWTVRLNRGLAARHLGQSPAEVAADLEARGVTLLPAHLDQSRYDQALASADVMLLPYGDRYETIGSGIFLECVCAGVIPLVPAHSTMRALYESLGGAAPAIESTTVEGIAAAVDQCAARLPELQGETAAVRDAWLNHPHGPRQWRQRVSTLMSTVFGP